MLILCLVIYSSFRFLLYLVIYISLVCRIINSLSYHQELCCCPCLEECSSAVTKTLEECSSAVESFIDLSPLHVFAAIDRTHVQIVVPESSTVDFFDRKQRYSIGCQRVCDGKLKFLAMSARFSDSLRDFGFGDKRKRSVQ